MAEMGFLFVLGGGLLGGLYCLLVLWELDRVASSTRKLVKLNEKMAIYLHRIMVRDDKH